MVFLPPVISQGPASPQNGPEGPGYQPIVMHPLRLLDCTGLPFDAPILHVGTDAAYLVPPLLERGYANHMVVQERFAALDQCRQRLPPAQAERVLWIVDDVTRSGHVAALDPVLLWHDRTRVHTLNTPTQRAGYHRLLNHMLSAHGWVLLEIPLTEAAALNAEKRTRETSSAVDRLAAFLAPDYALRHVFEEVHLAPSRESYPPTYALFQRNDTCRQGPWTVA